MSVMRTSWKHEVIPRERPGSAGAQVRWMHRPTAAPGGRRREGHRTGARSASLRFRIAMPWSP